MLLPSVLGAFWKTLYSTLLVIPEKPCLPYWAPYQLVLCWWVVMTEITSQPFFQHIGLFRLYTLSPPNLPSYNCTTIIITMFIFIYAF